MNVPLPDETLVSIFSFLPVGDLMSCSLVGIVLILAIMLFLQVCKKWHKLILDDTLWKRHCQELDYDIAAAMVSEFLAISSYRSAYLQHLKIENAILIYSKKDVLQNIEGLIK